MEEAAGIRSRPRRLRASENMRSIVRESRLDVEQLVAPVFIRYGSGITESIPSMPGVSRYSVDNAGSRASELADLGIKSVLLFGIPEHKDSAGSGAYDENGIVPLAIKAIKDSVPSMIVMADVCMCEYTDHGHCGILKGQTVDNDKTLDFLGRCAVQYAKAGADVVAPSAMMDGQVGRIRSALDGAGYTGTAIMGYSAKYASAMYGPFRDAAGSAPSFGDRRTYQMDPANAAEAMREIELDVQEGADIIMVKPALAYLDVVSAAKKRFSVTLAAYNVSGEYAMVKAAGMNKWLDGKRVMLEILTSIKRAGADIIITYHAEEAARVLANK
ncbi:MAG: porphobilinogen synthase [Candidatus Marsarchaeota archaeon]|nr:porphobilinogen synthase [Candidatus Marsarchaeota archaeon]